MQWFRIWHGFLDSVKWTLVAQRAECSRGDVLNVAIFLIDHASKEENRGSIEGFCYDELEGVTDVTRDKAERIVTQMKSLSRPLFDGNKFRNWERYQPRDKTAAERKRRQRERESKEKQLLSERDDTASHDKTQDVTRDVTPEQNRTEQNIKNLSSPNKLNKPLSVDWMVKAWNEKAERIGLPAVQRITTQRRQVLRKRFAEDFDSDESQFRRFIDRVAASPHLTGDNNRSWRADFDWCLKPANLLKILEGNYDPRLPSRRVNGQSPPKRDPDKSVQFDRDQLMSVHDDLLQGQANG